MDMPVSDEVKRFLTTPFLEGVDRESRIALYQSLEAGHAPKGTPLLSQDQVNNRLWFVQDGTVSIERTQADGHVEVMATLSGPAIYGTTTFFRHSAPSATIRARTDLTLWTLDDRAHERLRLENPRAAEALVTAIVRILSERFDMLDHRLAELMAGHDADHPRANEWANFRTRLFEEPAL